MVKLRVSVGGSYTDLAVINCNDELRPIEFDTPEFKGRAVVRIKDFVGLTSDGSEPIYNSDYFKGHNRKFSFQIEGRFKREWDGEQVYFGTDFDHAVDLPKGFDIMFKIAKYIDPVVKSITEGENPWILSPLVSSINIMSAWRPQDQNLPSPPLTPRPSGEMMRPTGLTDPSHGHTHKLGLLGKLRRSHQYDSSCDGCNSHQSSPNSSTDRLSIQVTTPTEPLDNSDTPLGLWRGHLEEDTSVCMRQKHFTNTTQRRKYFQTEQARREFVFKPYLVYGFEFFSPHIDFNTFDIHLGLSMNIRKYLRGQPVRYTCRTLSGDKVFWAVQFELVD
ncbi:hypothetical protein BGZ80_002730 [Entomortierella chlamydospora]|uniref:Domain of unknown function at the cortex 1 domain-containing protein n=1 Tax=Entomortierella chlamydospora TaxID=101097 RepID=A0A9P6MP09_9FUNG|nr:hypothetical protein BGZ79_002578 [Entomortierella chlamydospora]KAG0009104.1 hypothetical protein BGZ80_002730 [Entomortierella chlamydospora]